MTLVKLARGTERESDGDKREGSEESAGQAADINIIQRMRLVKMASDLLNPARENMVGVNIVGGSTAPVLVARQAHVGSVMMVN